MENWIWEEARQVPVLGEYDVIVAGGGIAGIAAAASARRAGAKRVLLIEKQFLLGGLATLGLVTIYLPLCDGEGRQVTFGMAQELLELSISLGAEVPLPECWAPGGSLEQRRQHRMRAQYNAGLMCLLSEQWLQKEGVEILYGTALCGAQVENGRIQAVICENKSGRVAYRAGSFVDATGDSDLCVLAGEKTAEFGQGNILAGWYYDTKDGINTLHTLGAADVPDCEKTEAQREADRRSRRYRGLEGAELSQMVQDAHQMTMAHFLKQGGFSQQRALTSLATIPQVRMTRRLAGVTTITQSDDHQYVKDSIGMIGDWRKRGPVYEMPFSALYGETIENLYCAGRNISADDGAWDITRVIPSCALTGEAAGIACVLGRDPGAVCQAMKARGVKLHLEDLKQG